MQQASGRTPQGRLHSVRTPQVGQGQDLGQVLALALTLTLALTLFVTLETLTLASPSLPLDWRYSDGIWQVGLSNLGQALTLETVTLDTLTLETLTQANPNLSWP